MPQLTTSRDGSPWKAYTNGRVLCAALRPFHDALNEDGTCDCLTREGETIAKFTFAFKNKAPR